MFKVYVDVLNVLYLTSFGVRDFAVIPEEIKF
jgi:hypothetical protein